MTDALYSPATGYNLSAIMTRALASARESRAWQARFAASPNGIKEGAKPQSWRFLIADALRPLGRSHAPSVRSTRQSRAARSHGRWQAWRPTADWPRNRVSADAPGKKQRHSAG